jgi:hypothetical protein
MDNQKKINLDPITFFEFKSVITTLDNITKLGYVNVSGSTYWLDSEEDIKALYKLYRDKQED